MKDKTLRLTIAFFVLISVVLVVVATFSVRNINRTAENNDWVNHTHAVISQIDALSTALYVTEATTEAYVASGNPNDLAAANRALSAITEHLELITALTRQELDQQPQIREINAQATAYANIIRSILAMQQEGRIAEARALLTATVSGANRPELLRQIKQLKEVELNLLSERDTAVYLQAETTRWTVWSGVALDVLLLIVAAWVIRDDLRARRREAQALQTANAELEARVQERTEELTTANQKLSTENLERQWTNQALEHQLHYNHSIVDSITDLIFVLTKSVNISRVNPAVAHNTRWEVTELIHQPLNKVLRLTADDQAAHEDLPHKVARYMREGRDLRDKTAVVINRDQTERPVLFSLFPLRDGSKVIGAVAILHLIPSEPRAKS